MVNCILADFLKCLGIQITIRSFDLVITISKGDCE